MPSDDWLTPPVDAEALIREARMHQAALVEHREKAHEHQVARDRLIHQLRDSDPVRWSYAKIAEAVGLERGAVIWILKQPIP